MEALVHKRLLLDTPPGLVAEVAIRFLEYPWRSEVLSVKRDAFATYSITYTPPRRLIGPRRTERLTLVMKSSIGSDGSYTVRFDEPSQKLAFIVSARARSGGTEVSLSCLGAGRYKPLCNELLSTIERLIPKTPAEAFERLAAMARIEVSTTDIRAGHRGGTPKPGSSEHLARAPPTPLRGEVPRQVKEAEEKEYRHLIRFSKEHRKYVLDEVSIARAVLRGKVLARLYGRGVSIDELISLVIEACRKSSTGAVVLVGYAAKGSLARLALYMDRGFYMAASVTDLDHGTRPVRTLTEIKRFLEDAGELNIVVYEFPR